MRRIQSQARRSRSTRSTKSISRPEPKKTMVVRGVRTTGLFTVPKGEGNRIELVVFLSSFSERSETVQVQVNRLVDEQYEPIFIRTITIPAGEVRNLVLEDVEGETVEVTVAPSDNLVQPSAGVTEIFLADGATVVLLWRAPGQFVEV